jgi:hypothetical protein
MADISRTNLPPKSTTPVNITKPETPIPLSVSSISYRQQTPREITLSQATDSNPQAKLEASLSNSSVVIKKRIIPYIVRLIQPFAIDGLQEIFPDVDLQALKSANLTSLDPNNLAVLQKLVTSNLTEEQKAKLREKNFCPTKEKLQEILEKKNKTVKVLNNLYTVSNLITATATGLSLYSALQRVRQTAYENNPIPVALPAIPPVPGYIPIPGFPVQIMSGGTVTKLAKGQRKAEERATTSAQLASQFLTIGTVLGISLQLVINLLNLLDILALICSQDQLTQEELSKDLVLFATQASEQGNTPVREYRGFKLDIKTESQPVGTLYRRFAVALNQEGVTLLKGQPSFSSSEQILLDEMKFLIDQNPGLKPF